MANDLTIYEELSHGWWEPNNLTFRSLRTVQEQRFTLLQQWVPHITVATVLDVGCGGGFFSVPLSNAGASVIGLDLSAASLAEAQQHAAAGSSFLCADGTTIPLQSNSVDHVVLADVVEHAAGWQSMLREASRVMRPGGYCYVSTMNRTWLGRFLGVYIAESLRLIPWGTHDWRMFITPEELQQAGAEVGLHFQKIQGESLQVWPTLRSWTIHLAFSDNTEISYCMLLQKEK